MRIDGEWFPCDDDKLRPIIRGEVMSATGTWEPVLFLVDTGADCTVLCAALLQVLGFQAEGTERQLGGTAPSVEISTHIRLATVDGRTVTFRGNYSAMTQLESLDFSVLGRDISNLFAVIVDRSADIVSLLRLPHRYTIDVVAR